MDENIKRIILTRKHGGTEKNKLKKEFLSGVSLWLRGSVWKMEMEKTWNKRIQRTADRRRWSLAMAIADKRENGGE